MSIYVIGGANIDIQGTPFEKLKYKDSNPGIISYSFGGVARNVAENLARLGDNVNFISVLGDDNYGKQLKKYCEDIGINMSNCLIKKGARTSTYLAILNDSNDMELAISDMSILDFLNKDYLINIIDKISKDDYVLIDTNLSKEIIEFLCNNIKGKIFIDPISTKKAPKLLNVFPSIYAIKPNIYEAEILCDKKINDLEDVKECARILNKKGVKEIYISLGEKGAYGFNGKKEFFYQIKNVKVKCATGAGDSFMAGIIHQKRLSQDLESTIKYASFCAVTTLQSNDTVSKSISDENINKLLFSLGENKDET